MKTIWKFPFRIEDVFTLDIPIDAEFLTVQMQRAVPTLWALVDDALPKTKYTFQVFGAGHPIPANFDKSDYLGTIQVNCEPSGNMDQLVFHVFHNRKAP